MKLFPAIDLLGGRAVRLEAGDRDRATVFHDRPVELVRELAADGADRLHVVDLDGAFGEVRQWDVVRVAPEVVRALLLQWEPLRREIKRLGHDL